MYIILVICGWVPIAGVKLDFGIFYGTYCFSPLLIFCAIYTLNIQTINNCSKWWKTDLCTVNIISCYDAEACPGRKINKSAGTDAKQFNMASLCDAYYRTRWISQFECYLTQMIGYLTPNSLILTETKEMKSCAKGQSLIQRWSGISLTNKQKRTFHSPVSWNETLF